MSCLFSYLCIVVLRQNLQDDVFVVPDLQVHGPDAAFDLFPLLDPITIIPQKNLLNMLTVI